jgi:hypothetical protein
MDLQQEPLAYNPKGYKAFIVWVKDNGRADWNYYDPRDEEIYSQREVLLRTDNQRQAVSLSVDYNLNAYLMTFYNISLVT